MSRLNTGPKPPKVKSGHTVARYALKLVGEFSLVAPPGCCNFPPGKMFAVRRWIRKLNNFFEIEPSGIASLRNYGKKRRNYEALNPA
ncbi:hypothetical protein AH97_26000 [Salmonella enterica subsp. enterica]|nr:hypothetical protein [Salmonella enterica subsp. enterica serovar Hartford]